MSLQANHFSVTQLPLSLKMGGHYQLAAFQDYWKRKRVYMQSAHWGPSTPSVDGSLAPPRWPGHSRGATPEGCTPEFGAAHWGCPCWSAGGALLEGRQAIGDRRTVSDAVGFMVAAASARRREDKRWAGTYRPPAGPSAAPPHPPNPGAPAPPSGRSPRRRDAAHSHRESLRPLHHGTLRLPSAARGGRCRARRRWGLPGELVPDCLQVTAPLASRASDAPAAWREVGGACSGGGAKRLWAKLWGRVRPLPDPLSLLLGSRLSSEPQEAAEIGRTKSRRARGLSNTSRAAPRVGCPGAVERVFEAAAGSQRDLYCHVQ